MLKQIVECKKFNTREISSSYCFTIQEISFGGNCFKELIQVMRFQIFKIFVFTLMHEIIFQR